MTDFLSFLFFFYCGLTLYSGIFGSFDGSQCIMGSGNPSAILAKPPTRHTGRTHVVSDELRVGYTRSILDCACPDNSGRREIMKIAKSKIGLNLRLV